MRTVVLQGDTSNLPLTNLIQTLALNQQEGILTVTYQRSVRCLAVRTNHVALLTDKPHDSALLPEVLGRLGILKPSEYQNVFATANNVRAPGDVLLERHLITHEQVDGPVREHLIEKVLETFLWTGAKYKFEIRPIPDDRELFMTESSGSRFESPINSILMEVARRQDEWERIKEHVDDSSQIYKIAAKPEEFHQHLEGEIGPEARDEIYQLFRGELTLEEAVAQASIPKFFLYSCLRSLLEAKIVVPATLEDKRRLAQSLRTNFQVQRAPQIYRSILAEDPNDTETRKQLVLLLERSRSSAPDLVEHYVILAKQAHRRGDQEEEERCLLKVHDLDPRNLVSIASLASMADLKRREKDWNRYLKLLVNTIHATKSFSEGSKLLVELAESRESDGFLKTEVAAMLATAGDLPKAAEWYCGSAEAFLDRKDTANLGKVIESLEKCDSSLTAHWRRRLADLQRTKVARRGTRKVLKALAIPLLLIGVIAVMVGYEWKARTAHAQAMDVARSLLSEGKEQEALAQLEGFRRRYSLSLVARSLADSRRELEAFNAAPIAKVEEAKKTPSSSRIVVSADLEATLSRAAALVTRGKYDEALEIYTSLDPHRFSPRIRSVVESERDRIGEYLSAAKRLSAQAKESANMGSLAESRELYMRIIFEYPLSREAQTAQIPVVIDTLPPTATVTQGGSRLAGPPFVARISVGMVEKIHVEAPGFLAQDFEVDPLSDWYVRVPLQRKPYLLVPSESSIEAQPLLSDGRLFYAPRSGTIEAADERTATPLWSFPIDQVGSALGSIRLWKNSIFFSSTNGSIYRLSLDGKLIGRVNLPTNIGIVRAPLTQPTDNGAMYFATEQGVVGRVDLNAEAIDWKFDLGSGCVAGPACLESAIVVSSEAGDLVALDPKDGSELWRRPIGRMEKSEIALHQTRIFFGTATQGILCLDARTGKEVWKNSTSASTLGSLTLAAGILCVVTDQGQLLGLEEADGTLRYSVDLGYQSKQGVVGNDRELFVLDNDGVIRTHDRENGLLLWQYDGQARPGVRLRIQGDRLLFAGLEGGVHVLSIVNE